MPFGGLLLGGILGAGTSIFTGVNASNAQKTAAQQQQTWDQNGINQIQSTLGQQTQNQSPYTGAGSSSISMLMQALQSGKFGVGSTGTAPTFTAPTLADAQNAPGYQFAQQQGDKGILAAQAASGGAITGGTSKALEGYNENLAQTNYSNVYNQALQGYQANLAGYQTNLAAQQQQFQQLLAPSQLGENATSSLNSNLTQGTLSIADLMSSIGTAQAGGTLGSTQALNQGIGGAVNSLSPIIPAAFGPGSGGGGGGNANYAFAPPGSPGSLGHPVGLTGFDSNGNRLGPG